MLSIPSIGFEDQEKKKAAPRAFVRYVNKEMGRAEALLKTLMSPSERLIPTFKALLPKSKNEELVKIMSLRGLKKSEQQALLQEYNKTVAAEERVDPSLVSESNLRKLFKDLGKFGDFK